VVSPCWHLVTVGDASTTIRSSSGTDRSLRRVDDRGRLGLGLAEQQALGQGPAGTALHEPVKEDNDACDMTRYCATNVLTRDKYVFRVRSA
jgi:hypothetical protein